jgi:hypothetical protein
MLVSINFFERIEGVAGKADWLRQEFLTGTATAVILALLILLVNHKGGRAVGFIRRCPLCDKRLIGNVNYCGECGSKL